MLNKYSSQITQPKSQGASQAMLYATGMSEADMNRAQVGIASVWYEGNPAICTCSTWQATPRKGSRQGSRRAAVQHDRRQ